MRERWRDGHEKTRYGGAGTGLVACVALARKARPATHETVLPKGTAGPPFDKLRTDGQCRPLEGVARSAAGVFLLMARRWRSAVPG